MTQEVDLVVKILCKQGVDIDRLKVLVKEALEEVLYNVPSVEASRVNVYLS